MILLSAFAARLGADLDTALPQAVVLDVRLNNGGDAGLLPPVIRALSAFRQRPPETPV